MLWQPRGLLQTGQYWRRPQTPAGGFTPTSTESANFLARATNITLDADKTIYDAMITGLVADGIFAKLDALYIFAAPDRATAYLNLIQNSFNLTELSAALTFTAYQGITGDGTNVLDTGLTPNTGGGQKFTQNSGSLGAYDRTSTSAWTGNTPIGSFRSIRTTLNLYVNFGAVNATLNSGGAASMSAGNAQGFWIGTRTASNAQSISKNGGTPTTDSTASSGLDDTSITIFGSHEGLGSTVGALITDQLSCTFIGGALTNTDIVNMSSRINIFMTAYGINVY